MHHDFLGPYMPPLPLDEVVERTTIVLVADKKISLAKPMASFLSSLPLG